MNTDLPCPYCDFVAQKHTPHVCTHGEKDLQARTKTWERRALAAEGELDALKAALKG